jgi:hypothetical protein
MKSNEIFLQIHIEYIQSLILVKFSLLTFRKRGLHVWNILIHLDMKKFWGVLMDAKQWCV